MVELLSKDLTSPASYVLLQVTSSKFVYKLQVGISFST